MTKWLKKELKKASKEKKRCKKLYPDWCDDEFNCGANKFIFGILSDDNKILKDVAQTGVPSFQTLNSMQVYYNRDTQKYLLDIDCFGYDLNTGVVPYLSELLKSFKDFIEIQFTTIKLQYLIDTNIFTYLEDMSNFWQADDLIALYAKFYIFVHGYKQLCKSKKKMEDGN